MARGPFKYNEGDTGVVGFTPTATDSGTVYRYWITSESATPGEDYEDVMGFLALEPGVQFSITFDIYDDEIVEGEESFIFNQEYTFSDGRVWRDDLRIIIVDNDLDARDDFFTADQLSLVNEGADIELSVAAGISLEYLDNDRFTTLTDVNLVSDADGRAKELLNLITYSFTTDGSLDLFGQTDQFEYRLEADGGEDTATITVQLPEEDKVIGFLNDEFKYRNDLISEIREDAITYEANIDRIDLNNDLSELYSKISVLDALISLGTGIATMYARYAAVAFEVARQIGTAQDDDIRIITSSIETVEGVVETSIQSGVTKGTIGSIAKEMGHLATMVDAGLDALSFLDYAVRVSLLDAENSRLSLENLGIAAKYSLTPGDSVLGGLSDLEDRYTAEAGKILLISANIGPLSGDSGSEGLFDSSHLVDTSELAPVLDGDLLLA